MTSDEERRWQQLGEDEVVYDGGLKIRRRTYRLPDGRTVEWDMHAGGPTVAVLALTPEGRLVMVRQFRPGPDRVVLTLPGGMIDPGESPLRAGERELREETGDSVGSVELAELRAGRMTGSEQAYLALDHAGLL